MLKKLNIKNTSGNGVEVKDDQWWVKNRPASFIGSIVKGTYLEYILQDDKFKKVELSYVAGFIKTINEIIDNSADVLYNSNKGKIDIEITKEYIKVSDNGNGIPIEFVTDLNGEKILSPKAAWGLAKAGTNFKDDESDECTIGTNGVGSFCTNVWSKKFIGTTEDGKHKFVGTWTNNSLEYEEKITESNKRGTTVLFYPDLEGFGMTEIDDTVVNIIRQRIINLSVIYKNITFKFNKEIIKFTTKQFFNFLGNDGEIYETENYSLAIFPTEIDDFESFSILNGLNLKGGTHIDYLLKYTIQEIKDKLPKKYDNIKPGDIKNKLKIAMIGNKFPNIVWDGQTKENIKNSDKDIRNYLGDDWKTILPKVAKNKNITDPIVFLYSAKLDAQEKLEASNADKQLKKVNIQKLRKASKENKFLFIVEGDSALKGIIKALGRLDKGYLPLKGVPANPNTSNIRTIVANAEYKDIMNALKLKFSDHNSVTDMDYEYVVIAADADVDGSHIIGLLVSFFWKFAPEIIENKKLLILKTPIKVAKNKKEDMVASFVTQDEYLEWEKENDGIPSGLFIEYKKGLGSMNEKEYQQFFKLRTFEKSLVSIDYSSNDIETMLSWVGDDSDFRKDAMQIRLKDFDMDSI